MLPLFVSRPILVSLRTNAIPFLHFFLVSLHPLCYEKNPIAKSGASKISAFRFSACGFAACGFLGHETSPALYAVRYAPAKRMTSR